MRKLCCGVVCAILTIVITGCAKSASLAGGQQPSSFPLYSPSTVASIGKYDDSLEVTKFGSSFFGEGADAAYPYVGVQELIKTGASLDDLELWTEHLVQSPPEGLHPFDRTSNGVRLNEPFVTSLKAFGLVPVEFSSTARSRVVMLVILDPKKVADRMSAALDVIGMWERMPEFMRASADQSLKKLVGVSASDLTDTNTPLGMITYAARNWKDENARAVLLIDADRQPNPLPTPHDN